MLTTSKNNKARPTERHQSFGRGFTLIELIVAVFDANRKSRSLKTVLNNLNLAVESMSKEIRFGKNYHCGSAGDTGTNTQNCPSGNVLMSFLSSGGVHITYRFNNQSIEKKVGAGSFVAVTAPEIIIDDL